MKLGDLAQSKCTSPESRGRRLIEDVERTFASPPGARPPIAPLHSTPTEHQALG
jgi:hypothetical protein